MKNLKNFESFVNESNNSVMYISDLGYKIIEKDGLYGMMDSNGEEILPIKYKYISDTISIPNNIIVCDDINGNKIKVLINDDSDSE